MAALRGIVLFLALLGFFLVGAPLQWIVTRVAPAGAHVIPLFFCRSLLRILKVSVVVRGDRLPAGPLLMAANHVSWIDILALGGLLPFCFLAKSEVASWPILSGFAAVQGTVFVDRKRRRSIPKANADLAARMREGRSALLFPEATTLAALGPFHTSHFAAAREFLRLVPSAAAVMVQPVAITYSSPAAAWVGDEALLPHLWRTLRAPPMTCRIVFATPIPYTIETNRKTVAAEARAAIAALVDHPILANDTVVAAPSLTAPDAPPATVG